MIRYSVILFGITVFALVAIWQIGSIEASQSSNDESVLWADTSHIKIESGSDNPKESPRKKRDSFLKEVKKLSSTAFNIRNQYMEEVDTDEIIKAGIRGMMTDLDRYSVLLEQSSYEALMESTHGKYEGLGMQIDSRENRIIIITPIEGTPAYRKGLRAGDIIWEIDGKSTEGMKTSDGAKLMRGQAGTSVILTIKRAGIADMMEFEVDRAVIELKSVPYAGVIPGTTIGYVRLSRFAEETSHELREALADLSDQNVSGLIFDLRSNGGGLLDQAKETAELFLQEGREIVYTKGRYESSERHFYSERAPLFADKPLVVLVNEGTASASEIVAGAVQDWDRGLIVGAPTYGKGLVQQIFQIANDGSMALKLTTAKYYVPSGRCIQKPEKQAKRGSHADQMLAEEAEKEGDTLAVTEEEDVFYTNGGRIVYGGGGIIPDTEIESDLYKPIEINLERKSLFFDFAIKYVAEHPDIKPGFEVTDAMVSQFRDFTVENEFEYKTSLQVALEDLRETVAEEESEELFAGSLADMDKLVEQEKSEDFERSREYIKRSIKREILSSIVGQRGVYDELILKTDKTVLKAVEILSTPGQYSDMIKRGQTKAELN
ncbi:MAG: S41 family peptidase [candidate division Zixibacteria bacterium]|nr:S41 family peptidase [candidate division Zixibacteria bacterium]MDH3937087.1 S41 family peptidase [candidate division Zixibacteria bacterium]MDH4033853.1 S41 family peptidase [candidate division Zixibacteria bacterium]